MTDTMTLTVERQLAVHDLVATLHLGNLHVTPVDRDWSVGYTETWDYAEAPDCGECGNTMRWRTGDGLLEQLNIDLDALRAEQQGYDDTETLTDEQRVRSESLYDAIPRYEQAEHEDHEAWRCVDPQCDAFGRDNDDARGDGPMMNYAYALHGSVTRVPLEQIADRIHDLPLCVIHDPYDRGNDDSYMLALTGGGMDLTWEIAAAYVALGQLPPVHFCDLPQMAGYPSCEQHHLVIAACRRSLQVHADRAANDVARFADRWPETIR